MGTVTVDGTNSKWTNTNTLYVGFYGSGTLKIIDGGMVSNTDGYIAYNSSYSSKSNVNVNGAGSTWTNTSNLYLKNHGRLKITGGGTVNDTNGYIGYEGPRGP